MVCRPRQKPFTKSSLNTSEWSVRSISPTLNGGFEAFSPTDGSTDTPKPKVRRKIRSPKINRVVLLEGNAGNKDRVDSRSMNFTASLAPCHVCKTSPKWKIDLEAYTDCERCSERTCLICSRVCHASCGRATICSGCCEERGIDGETWCLDCLGDKRDLYMHQ